VTKLTRCIPALGAVFFVCLTLSACGGGIPGDAVVQVSGTPISKTTFEHWLGVAAASSAATPAGQTASKPVIPDPPSYTACIAHLQAIAPKPAKGQSPPTTAQLKSQCEQQYNSYKQEVLGFLISSQWVLSEAAAMGVNVSDAEVQKQFNKLKTQQFPKEAEFQKFLASSGQTVSDLLLRVKLNLVSSKIEQKISKSGGKAVTQAQIAKYYEENKARLGKPESRDVQIILTKTQAEAEKAKQEIESGKSFSSVAKSVSIDPSTKANGGKLPGVVKGQEQKALDEAIFSAKPNVLTGPVKTPFGYYIFEVTAIHPGTQQTLAQAEASIRQQLATQNQQAALTKFSTEFRKKWQARTECRSEYVVADCKEYKAPKTTPSTAVPQTGTPQSGTPQSGTPQTTTGK